MSLECYPEVAQTVAGPGKKVYAYFSDGKKTMLDMASAIAAGGVFSKLSDDAFFRDALTVLNGAVAWDVSGVYDPTTCIDIDPFAAYEAERVVDPLELGVA